MLLPLVAGREYDQISSKRLSAAHLHAAWDELGDIGKLQQSDRARDDEIRAADVEVIAAATGQIFELPAGFVLAKIEPEAFTLEAIEQVPVQISCLLGKPDMTSLRHRQRDRCRDEVAILE